jgi:hypothetical protein
MRRHPGGKPVNEVTSDAPDVLLIGGSGRSGSTLLASILGQSEGWVNLGELMYLWRLRQPGSTWLCGCEALLVECPFWQAVEDRAPSAMRLDAEAASLALSSRASSQWPRLLRSDPSTMNAFGRWAGATQDLYAAAAEVAGGHVVIDSSKLPNALLASLRAQRSTTSLLHLVREPVDVVASWRIAKPAEGDAGEALYAIRPSRATYNWLAQTLVTDLMVSRRLQPGRFRRLRYEEFAASPEAITRELLEWMGEERPPSCFVGPTEVDLARDHSFVGNPDRHGSTRRRIEPVASQRNRLSRTECLVVEVATWPAARRFGYR